MIKESRLPSATGTGDMYIRFWIPDDRQPRAVLQLTHGMAEHIDRYDDFARFLNEKGVICVGQDHAGHGKSIDPSRGKQGYFGEKDGWTHLLEDMQSVCRLAKQEHSELPFILMGHSMGSFLARSYASRFPEGIDVFIFSGTAGKNPALPVAKWLVKREIKKHGAKGAGDKLDKLAFGSYAKAIPDAKTAFDWLSHDEAIVNAYNQDPLCGFVFTLGGFRDLFDGLTEIQHKDWAKKVPQKPILIFSGSADPVGGKNAAGPREVAQALSNTDHDVTLKIYENGRHEMLNEKEKLSVYQDVLTFIEKQVL